MGKMTEHWQIIPDFDGKYLISKTGRVFSVFANKEMMLEKHRSGYLRVGLYKNHKQIHCLIHRLVAETYIDNPNKKLFVNHIDGNKQNNAVQNLEWVTASENQKHAYKIGLQKVNVKAAHLVAHEQTKRKVAMLDERGKILDVFDSIKEAAKSIGMNDGTHISAVARGKRAVCGGYKWRYI